MTSKRLLVVDDNRESAIALGSLLLSWGHQVQLAYDGHSAVDLARRLRPDFIFLDLGLPGFDGYDVANALRQDPSSRAARIVAVTALGSDEQRARARGCGIEMHLTKPVQPEYIASLLGTPMKRRAPDRRAPNSG